MDVTIHDVVEAHLVTAMFQPIVDLATGDVVAFEALARGPVGSALESPDALLAAARAAGLHTELDWACRAVAVRAALDAGLDRRVRLFINVEPSSFATPHPSDLDELFLLGADQLSIVFEVTERDIMANPASLIGALQDIRALGFGVAIDDVGADPSSLAFLPFIEPDVIKLDLSMVQRPMEPSIAAIAAAVSADAERRGATIVAEGIESEAERRRAIVLGATLGQGWLFGRPDELQPAPSGRQPSWRGDVVSTRPNDVAETPWSLVADSHQRRQAAKTLLLPISRHVEQGALRTDDDHVLLGAFQHARYFTPGTVKRYEHLARQCSFVAALGADMSESPATGVRGAHLAGDHPLLQEWTVIVTGSHYASALIAVDLGDTGPDGDRRFDYLVTHDRELVIEAARSLMQYIVRATSMPSASGAQPGLRRSSGAPA